MENKTLICASCGFEIDNSNGDAVCPKCGETKALSTDNEVIGSDEYGEYLNAYKKAIKNDEGYYIYYEKLINGDNSVLAEKIKGVQKKYNETVRLIQEQDKKITENANKQNGRTIFVGIGFALTCIIFIVAGIMFKTTGNKLQPIILMFAAVLVLALFILIGNKIDHKQRLEFGPLIEEAEKEKENQQKKMNDIKNEISNITV